MPGLAVAPLGDPNKSAEKALLAGALSLSPPCQPLAAEGLMGCQLVPAFKRPASAGSTEVVLPEAPWEAIGLAGNWLSCNKLARSKAGMPKLANPGTNPLPKPRRLLGKFRSSSNSNCRR